MQQGSQGVIDEGVAGMLDGLAGGSGAWSDRDGLHAYGTYSMLEPNIANVEQTENVIPMLFLYRRLLRDSGGAGARSDTLSSMVSRVSPARLAVMYSG